MESDLFGTHLLVVIDHHEAPVYSAEAYKTVAGGGFIARLPNPIARNRALEPGRSPASTNGRSPTPSGLSTPAFANGARLP